MFVANMDIHDEDEVTREPFEDQEGLEDDNQGEEEEHETHGSSRATRFGGQSMAAWQQPEYDRGVAPDDNDRGRGQIEMSIEQMDAQESADDDLSSVDDQDIEYAESFKIQLATSKSQAAAYKRLMNSDYIVGSQSCEQKTSSSSPSTTTKRGEPRIETSVTSDCIYHRGTFYQRGDIVALCDQDDGQLYFAQLTGFLQDQYCEKSATVSWLVPTRPTSRDHFDPRAYKIGLEDVQLRKLDCMTFVRHCPHDYYLRKFFQPIGEEEKEEPDTSNRHLGRPDRGSYIWTSLDVCKAPVIHRGTAR